MKFNFAKKIVIKTPISTGIKKNLLKIVEENIQKKQSLLISPVASYTLVRAVFEKNLCLILQKFNYLVPDSQWIRFALFFLYGVWLKERLYGPDLMLSLCSFAQDKKYRIFLYGTTKKTLMKLKKNLKKTFPDLLIVGSMPSQFRNLSSDEKRIVIEKIKRVKSQLIFVGIGSPLQEIFAWDLVYKEPVFNMSITIVPVGAAFDFLSGVKPQSPEWMRNIGFEWLFRLLTEPRRLWKRYLIYGPLFIMLILFQKAQMLFNGIYNKIPKINFFGKKGE